MKNIIICILTVGLSITLLQACGPGEEEIHRQGEADQQARLDSLEQVWEVEMEQMRQDSIEQAHQDSIANAAAAESEPAQPQPAAVTYDNNGLYTVQVRSWRSEDKAREHAEDWKNKGFEHAYVEQHGDESIGDVWFRVRMGNVPTFGMAQKLQEELQSEHNTDSWIAGTDS
ncbi:MAG: SPOR domain-containing protein [Balneolaceae bacterium]